MQINCTLSRKKTSLVPGGSAANTAVVFAQLGGNAAFCGKVGEGPVAKYYESSLVETGVESKLAGSKTSTGRTIALVTPDSERSFVIYLGAAEELAKENIDPDSVRQSKILHAEGYISASLIGVDGRVSLDCADPHIITRCKDEMIGVIEKYVDVVFANQEEAKALTGSDNTSDALNSLAKICDIAVVKLGKDGSLVRQRERMVKIDPVVVEDVDTTGAGDSYAGAFLYALSQGHDIKKAGDLGSYISAKVVERIGARLQEIPDYSHII
jgi:sugar/nucleoside kinase (ribokinase family)